MTVFTTTKQAHEGCGGCAEMAQRAEGIARATGSVGGSYEDGTHSATVERAPVAVTGKQEAFYAAQDARVRKDEEAMALNQQIEIAELELQRLREVADLVRREADELEVAERAAWAELEASGEYVPPVSDY